MPRFGFAAAFGRRRLPRHTITFGAIASSLAQQERRAGLTSSRSGVRFSGGRHFTTLQMYTSLRCKPIASIICVSKFSGAADERKYPACLRRGPGLRRQTPVRLWDCRRRRRCLLRVLCSLQRVHSPRSVANLEQRVVGNLSNVSNSDGPARDQQRIDLRRDLGEGRLAERIARLWTIPASNGFWQSRILVLDFLGTHVLRTRPRSA